MRVISQSLNFTSVILLLTANQRIFYLVLTYVHATRCLNFRKTSLKHNRDTSGLPKCPLTTFISILVAYLIRQDVKWRDLDYLFKKPVKMLEIIRTKSYIRIFRNNIILLYRYLLNP